MVFNSGFGEIPNIEVHGQGWTEVGKIGAISDTLINNSTLNIEGNSLASMGAQFTLYADLTDNSEGAFGFGVRQASHAVGTGQEPFFTISLFENFLTESRIKWYSGEKASPALSATLGNFQYKYNRHSKNLGLYLLRGPVYPGLLMGGWGDFYTDPSKAPFMGLKLSQNLGSFSHDLILNNERDIPPTFDWSLAYIAKYKAGEILEVGAGVNFYRGTGIQFLDDKFFVQNKDLLTPGHLPNGKLARKKYKYIEVDTLTNDTVFFTHQGIKLMGYWALDIKPLLGIESPNPQDFILYSEVAVIGLKDYGITYGKISERIPLMVGFNIPTFGFLDLLSVEVEYYGSKHKNDLALIGNNNVVAPWTRQDHPIPSPKPVTYEDYKINGIAFDENGLLIDGVDTLLNIKGTAMDAENMTTDNIKWSLNVAKVIQNHIKFEFQLANDHYRPRPVAIGVINSAGGTSTAFSDTSDWYLMMKTSFLF